MLVLGEGKESKREVEARSQSVWKTQARALGGGQLNSFPYPQGCWRPAEPDEGTLPEPKEEGLQLSQSSSKTVLPGFGSCNVGREM